MVDQFALIRERPQTAVPPEAATVHRRTGPRVRPSVVELFDHLVRRVLKAARYSCMLSATPIQRVVAEQFGLTRAQLLGRSHLPHIVRARHLAQLLCLEMLPGASLPQVGLWFGRDHSTVLHARERMRRKIAVNRDFAKQVEKLRRRIIAAA